MIVGIVGLSRGMPRLRLAAARFLRARLPASPFAASCSFCETASAAVAGTSSRSSPFNSASTLSRKPICSSALLSVEVEKERFPTLFGTFANRASSSVARDRSSSSYSSYAHASRPLVGDVHVSGSSDVGDPHRDLIIGVSKRVSLLGRRPRNRSGLRSFSVVHSNGRATAGHDGGDGQQQQEHAIPNSSSAEQVVVSPSLEKCEKETDCVDDAEGFFSADDNTPAPGNDRRSTTLLYDDEGEEKPCAYDAYWSTGSEDESDLSELDFVEMGSHAEDVDDGELEAGDSRPEEEEDKQWTGSMLERMPLEASTDKEEGISGLFLESLDVASTAEADSRDLTESEPHGLHKDGLPYLHTLSVNEVREILEKARAKDVTILPVRKCCEWVDHLVFASGRSCRHLRGMADAIVYKVKQQSENVGPNSYPLVEGRDGEQWMAVDCGNIVIHLFSEEARSYYNLEEFWTKKSNPRLVEPY